MVKQQKPYVIIQSQTTIQVTCGLQNKDVTNPDAHVPDRLKVSPLWSKATIVIHEGKHTYPAEIVEWPTVKALEKDEILTIGQFVDEADSETKEQTEDLKRVMVEQGLTKKIVDINVPEEKKAGSLADIAGEE